MNVTTVAALLRERARLRTHDGWSRDEVLAFQARRLADLRSPIGGTTAARGCKLDSGDDPARYLDPAWVPSM